MKKLLFILFVLLSSIGALANETFITDVMVIGGSKAEVDSLKVALAAQGWTLVNKDLNAGAGGDYIFLLYKSDYVNSGYITGFYLSNKSGTADDEIRFENRTYSLVSYDGGSRFEELKGDLNCGAKGDYIHLYITRDEMPNVHGVTGISFNNVQDGAVGKNGGTTGYDLNAGCGSSSEYIYMHFTTAQAGWVSRDVATNQCRITGYNGKYDEITTLTVPNVVDHSTVISFDYTMDFSVFTNLETLNFYSTSIIEEMPSLEGLTKFKHVNVLDAEGGNHTSANVLYPDQTPDKIITLHSRAFAGTAIERLTLPGVTNVPDGPYVGVFEGCNSLQMVTFKKVAYIGENAFANIHSDNCVVVYPGSIDNWNYEKFHHSPNFVVRDTDSNWFAGWCGNTEANNCVIWKFENGVLTIDCGDETYYDNYPQAQVISTHWWEGCGITYPKVVLNGVYSLNNKEFTSTNIEEFFLNPTLKVISENAIKDSQKLKDIWYDGTDEQWRGVSKASEWTTGSLAGKAHWHCTVSFEANGYGVAPEPQEIEWSNLGKAVDPGAPEVTGYDFTGWYTEAECTNLWNFEDEVPGDMTLYAGWDFVAGDVDGSGKVDGSDLNMLINIILGKLSATDASVKGEPNVDGEGGIDGSDLNMLINIILGKN